MLCEPPGTEFKTSKEKKTAPKFNIVSFIDDNLTASLRGKVYAKKVGFNERLTVLQQDPSLATAVLRGLKEQISALASAQVPNSVIYAQIPELARQNCESAGLDYDSVGAGRYLLTLDQVHNRVRETKRVMLGHNVGDLAQTESLIDAALETHFVD